MPDTTARRSSRSCPRYHDARYGAFSRLVRSTFDEAVQHFSDASVDLLHVDGYHTYEAVARDFETWGPKLSARAVVLFHDINVREGDFGVWRLWDELRSGYPHFEFLHAHGLGVLGVGSDLPAAVTALLRTTRDATGVGRIRDAFARLGSAVVERMHFQARAEALQNEIDRLGEALRAAGQEVAARDELIRRGADERAGREAEIAEQRRLIEQLGQERAGREAEIAERHRLIEQLGQERAGREAEIAEQRRLIEQLGQERAGREAEIAEQGRLIEQLGQERAGREAEIAKQGRLIERLGQERAGREAEIAKQGRLIERLGQERAGREAEIAEQRRLIEELQHEIVRLGRLRVADCQELTGVGERLHRVEREHAEAHDEVETLRAALMALHQSRSIRLTRPLRQAGGWYRSTVAWVRRGARPP